MSYVGFRSDVGGITTLGDYCLYRADLGYCSDVLARYDPAGYALRYHAGYTLVGGTCPSDPVMYDSAARGLLVGSAKTCLPAPA